MEGWYGRNVLPMFQHVEYVIPKTEYIIKKGDIQSYFTESVFQQIAMWKTWKRLGDPFGGGWSEWPAVFLDIIGALEDEYNKRMNSGNK